MQTFARRRGKRARAIDPPGGAASEAVFASLLQQQKQDNRLEDGDDTRQTQRQCPESDTAPATGSNKRARGQHLSDCSTAPGTTGSKQLTLYAMLGRSLPSLLPGDSPRHRRRRGTGRRVSALPPGQLFLDLGQRGVGQVVCPTCQLCYTAGKPEDEAVHQRQHKAVVQGVEFPGWKDEHVVASYPLRDARILDVSNTAALTQARRHRLSLVHEAVTRDLGGADLPARPDASTWIYVRRSRVVGLVTAEAIDHAFRVVPANTARAVGGDGCTGDGGCGDGDDENTDHLRDNVDDADDDEEGEDDGSGRQGCSVVRGTQRFPARCGINRIWVHPSARRSGVATLLLECVRRHFAAFADTLARDDIAFSQPTSQGAVLATRYFQRPDYLVYTYQGHDDAA